MNKDLLMSVLTKRLPEYHPDFLKEIVDEVSLAVKDSESNFMRYYINGYSGGMAEFLQSELDPNKAEKTALSYLKTNLYDKVVVSTLDGKYTSTYL